MGAQLTSDIRAYMDAHPGVKYTEARRIILAGGDADPSPPPRIPDAVARLFDLADNVRAATGSRVLNPVWIRLTVPLSECAVGSIVEWGREYGLYLGEGRLLVDGGRVTAPDASAKVNAFHAVAGATEGDDGAEVTHITLSDILGMYSPSESDILKLWRRNEFFTDLSVPIGGDVNGNPLTINLAAEQAGGNGPHGIVTGMTGSGASEVVSNIVYSLAAQYSPSKVSFALVAPNPDAAGPLRKRDIPPHVVANLSVMLDGYGSLYDPLTSFVGNEMARRETLLRDHDVRDFYEYRAKTILDENLPPLPYLLVLVSDRPDMPLSVRALDDISRKGRSLGIGLLLVGSEGTAASSLLSHITYAVSLRVGTASYSRAILDGDARGTELRLGGEALVRHGEYGGEVRVDRVWALRPETAEVRASLMDSLKSAASKWPPCPAVWVPDE